MGAPTTRTRGLQAAQAGRCEHARTTRCRCRCGGTQHGASRVTIDELPLLREGDPHHVKVNGQIRLGEVA